MSKVSHKHAVMLQYRACTGLMLAASDQYRPGTGNLFFPQDRLVDDLERQSQGWTAGNQGPSPCLIALKADIKALCEDLVRNTQVKYVPQRFF